MGGFDTKSQEQANMASAEQRSDSNAWNNAYNQAAQQAQSQTTLSGQQSPFLQQLWGQGAGLAGSDPGIAGEARGAWGEALNAGVNPGVADVIANASREMGLNFSRNTMPAIRSGAVGTGSLGGSRQGIAEGLAAGELARNQGNMATTLYTQALDQASRERTAALSMSGQMQALPWQGLESFGRVMGAPVMESYGSSGGSSFGTSAGGTVTGSHGYAVSGGSGKSDAFGMNVLGKGGTAGAR